MADSKHEGSETNGRPAKPLVLVVDDEPGVRKALERYLGSIGYIVAAAADGVEGLRMAEALKPTVILTDVRMPVMDGHGLLRRLNELGRNSSVVLMSGSGTIDDAIGAIRHGAVDYLKKPWTLEELARVVNRARDLAESLDQIAHEHRVPGAPATHRVRTGTGTPAAGGGGGVAPAGPPEVEGPPPIDGVAIVERVVERATRDRELPAAPVAFTRPGSLDAGALRAAFPIRLDALTALVDRICRFSEARSLAMRGIAEVADGELGLEPLRCQHAGMLFDVGAMCLLSAIDDTLVKAGAPIADVPKMRAAIDARHPLVGSLILETWGIDAELVNLTHDHHATSLPSSTPALWCAAALGGALAVHLTGFGDPLGENGLTSDMLARCAYRLGVGDTTLRRLTQSLVPEANRIWEA